MSLKVYGIPNCDTVKKAFNWLKQNNLEFDFHDYKKEGVSKAKLKEWSSLVKWDTIFNVRSSTWRNLAKEGAALPTTQAQAIALMQENNSIIKRPVIEVNGEIILGFDEKEYFQKLINHS